MTDELIGAIELARDMRLVSPESCRVVGEALAAGQISRELETVAQALGLQLEILISLQLLAVEVQRPVKFAAGGDGSTQQQGQLPIKRYFGRRPLSQLGKYQVLSEFAQGGMGVLYQALDPDLERVVALKVLRDLDGGEEMIERLRREAMLAARLSHPNIITVHEVGVAQDELTQATVHFIAMDFIDGETLGHQLPLMTLAERIDVLEPVAQAVGHAHQAGVIHRDIKPSNILLTRDGRPIVTDFGLARGEGSQQLTRSGTVLGTDSYMAPEQVLAMDHAIDARTDVWALGVMLYMMLTDTLPFRGQAAAEIYEQILHFNPVPPRRLAPAIGRDLETICLKALEKDRQRRYCDGQALADELLRWKAGEPIAARPPSRMYRLRKWIGRNQAASLATLAMVLLVGGTLAGLHWQSSALQQAREQARVEDRQAQVEQGLAQARQLLARASTISTLRQPAKLRSLPDGGQRPETPAQRYKRESALGDYLAACSMLDRVLALAPGHREARALRRQAGERLGQVAILGADYMLAERAFRDLKAFGAPDEDIGVLIASLHGTRDRRAQQQASRLRQILAELKAGLSRPGRDPAAPTLRDFVFEAVGYREAQTIGILAQALQSLQGKARRGGRATSWQQWERDQAIFISRVLGRLRLREAVHPLLDWMALVWDRELAVEAGLALCNTRSALAHGALVEARNRLGADSTAWRQIAVAFGRVPEPHAKAGVQTVSSLYRRGLSRMDKGDWRGAADDFEEAARREPDRFDLLNMCGVANLNLKRTEQALRYLTRALKLNPRSATVWNNRGLALYQQKRIERAIRDFDQAIRQDSRLVSAFNNRGLAFQALGRLEAALADFSRSIKLRPQQATGYINRAQVLQRLERHDEALGDNDRAIELDPRNADYRTARGITQMRRGALKQAMDDFTRAIQLDPRASVAYHNRGVIRRRLGDLPGAVVDYDEAIKLAPKKGGSYFSRGYVLVRLKKFAAAMRDYTRAIELDPRHAKAYLNRGQMHAAQGRAKQAILDFEQVIKLRPKWDMGYANRGSVHLRAGDLAGALRDLERAVALNERAWYAWFNLGLVRERQRKRPETLAALRKAQKYAPADRQASIARKIRKVEAGG